MNSKLASLGMKRHGSRDKKVANIIIFIRFCMNPNGLNVFDLPQILSYLYTGSAGNMKKYFFLLILVSLLNAGAKSEVEDVDLGEYWGDITVTLGKLFIVDTDEVAAQNPSHSGVLCFFSEHGEMD